MRRNPSILQGVVTPTIEKQFEFVTLMMQFPGVVRLPRIIRARRADRDPPL